MIENGIYTEQGPKIRESDRLTFATLLAVAFHAMIFMGITFALPEQKAQPSSPVMQVVLAQYHALEKPDKADFIGQDDQQGGGQQDLLQTPTTTEIAQIPDPSKQASLSSLPAVAPEQRQPRPDLLTGNGINRVFLEQQQDAPEEQQPLMDTATLLQKSYELSGLNAQLDDHQQLASRNLRKRQVSAAIHRASDALYLDTWRRRIEEVGNRNYPAAAKQNRLYGELLLKVAVNADGTIRDLAILQSSGHKILDEAAIQIVRLAAPFAPFDDELRRDTDVLEIIRLWQFQPGDVVSTQ